MPFHTHSRANDMREITFDIETRNLIPAFGRGDMTKLDLAIVGIHDSETNEYSSYSQEELPKLWPIIEKADVLIGFNSDSFDVPLLNNYYPGDLTKIRSIDLLSEVYKMLGRRIRLQTLAEATLEMPNTTWTQSKFPGGRRRRGDPGSDSGGDTAGSLAPPPLPTTPC